MNLEDFVSKLQGLKRAGDGKWIAKCPAHKDGNPSLSIARGDNGGIVLKCFAGCTTDDVCRSLGLTTKDLAPSEKQNGHKKQQKILAATYQYKDESGDILYEKLRYVPKTFRIRRPDPQKKGEWIWSLNGCRKVLYHLPELRQAIASHKPVYFVEGEKDVETLSKNGFTATCNPCGAEEEWDAGYTECLRDSDLTILPDRDAPGEALANRISESISSSVSSLRIVKLPNRKGKKVKDVTDWFDAGGTPEEFLTILSSPPEPDPTEQIWSLKDLIAYDTDRDQNAVIGMHDGKTTRYLDQGCGMFFIGQSGIGKSTLLIQQGCCWALGRPFYGILPVRPLRVLVVQSENDQGDCAEAIQGIMDSINISPADFDELNTRFKIIRCRGRTGLTFCKWLQDKAFEFNADLVYVDPLLRFAGIDVSRQDQCTRFLNEQLDPVLAETKIVLIAAHHTGKPKSAKETAGWSIYDYAYFGIGSSELVNWARSIAILRVLNGDDGTFDLLLAKRGPRAWASHPNGDFSSTLYLRHAPKGIFWEQIDPSELQQSQSKSSEKNTGGRPSKITELASMNLFEFCNLCKPEGEGLREISKRFESWCATTRIDISLTTARRTIAALVSNGKLCKYTDGKYLKGPNA